MAKWLGTKIYTVPNLAQYCTLIGHYGDDLIGQFSKRLFYLILPLKLSSSHAVYRNEFNHPQGNLKKKMATLSLIGPLARVKSSGCLLTGLTVWRTYKSSSIRFGGELSEKNEVEGSHDKSTATLQPVQLSGHCSLIDLAKQTEGMEKSEQFTLALNEFLVREKYRKGHIGFIRTAMLRMDEFGLEKDLETYNKLIDIFPRGRFAPRSMIDAFWPRSTPQLELCLEVLTKMEENGVRPSIHTYKIIKAIFGRSLPLEKCIRIMYLFDIYGDMDPYEVRGELPTDPIELSRLALFRMSGENTQLMEIQARL